MSSHVKYTQSKNDVIYVQSFGDTYLTLTLLFYLILPRLSLLQPRNESLHFILSDNDDYDFDVKVGCCKFVGFVDDVINRECLGYVFCFRIKEKEKDTFYINFYSIIFSKVFFSLLQLNNYNGYVYAIYNCLLFMMNPLLIKFYKNYAIIHIQYSPKSSYIKHYNIIRALHG